MIQESDVIGMRSEVVLCDISFLYDKYRYFTIHLKISTYPPGGWGGVLRIYVDKLMFQLFLSP